MHVVNWVIDFWPSFAPGTLDALFFTDRGCLEVTIMRQLYGHWEKSRLLGQKIKQGEGKFGSPTEKSLKP